MQVHEFSVSFKCSGDRLGDALAALDPIAISELSVRLVAASSPPAKRESKFVGSHIIADSAPGAQTGARGLTPIRQAMLSAFKNRAEATPGEMKHSADASGNLPSKSALISGIAWLTANKYLIKVSYGTYKLGPEGQKLMGR
jgi:hypothetical protein